MHRRIHSDGVLPSHVNAAFDLFPPVPARKLGFTGKLFVTFICRAFFCASLLAAIESQRTPRLFRTGSGAVFGMRSSQEVQGAWGTARVSLSIALSTRK